MNPITLIYVTIRLPSPQSPIGFSSIGDPPSSADVLCLCPCIFGVVDTTKGNSTNIELPASNSLFTILVSPYKALLVFCFLLLLVVECDLKCASAILPVQCSGPVHSAVPPVECTRQKRIPEIAWMPQNESKKFFISGHYLQFTEELQTSISLQTDDTYCTLQEIFHLNYDSHACNLKTLTQEILWVAFLTKVNNNSVASVDRAFRLQIDCVILQIQEVVAYKYIFTLNKYLSILGFSAPVKTESS